MHAAADPGATYRAGNLDEDLGHADEGLVVVLDGLGGVVVGLVAHIANAAVGKELDVGHGEF